LVYKGLQALVLLENGGGKAISAMNWSNPNPDSPMPKTLNSCGRLLIYGLHASAFSQRIEQRGGPALLF
jgi:hypothetical protein